MALRDFFNGSRSQSLTLPRNAKVARRRRRNGGTDVGYWSGSQFFLLDGTVTDGYEYVGGTGHVLSTQVAQVELERAGYEHDANYYTAPSDTSSASPSYSTPDSYSPSGSSSLYASGSGSSSSGSSYDSSSGSSSSSSYDSGSSSSSSSDW